MKILPLLFIGNISNNKLNIDAKKNKLFELTLFKYFLFLKTNLINITNSIIAKMIPIIPSSVKISK